MMLGSLFTDFNYVPEKMDLREYFRNLTDEQREKYWERAEARGSIAPRDDGFFGEFADRAAGGFIGGLEGVGATLNELGLGSGMQDYFQGVLRNNQQWNAPENRSIGGYIGGAVGNVLGSAAGSLAAGTAGSVIGTAVGGPGAGTVAGFASGWAASFVQSFGKNVQRNRSAGYGENKAYGMAFLESTIDAGIENLPFGIVGKSGKYVVNASRMAKISAAGKKELLKKVGQSMAKQVGQEKAQNLLLQWGKKAAASGLGEGGEEGLQYLNTYLNRKLGGDPGAEFSVRELADAIGQGIIGGFAFGTVTGGIETRQEARLRNFKAAEKNSVSGAEVDAVPGESDVSGVADRERAMFDTLLTEVGNSLGIKIDFMDNRPDGVELQKTKNGFYDPADNTLYLNRNTYSVNPSESLGHEVKHYIDTQVPELSQAFDALIEAGKNEAGKQEVAEIITELGLSEEAGNADFSADIFGKLFARPETWQKTALYLDEKTPGMGEKFLQVLRDFYTLVKTKLAELAGTNPEAETYLNNVTELQEEAARMLAELQKRKGNGATESVATTEKTPDVVPTKSNADSKNALTKMRDAFKNRKKLLNSTSNQILWTDIAREYADGQVLAKEADNNILQEIIDMAKEDYLWSESRSVLYAISQNTSFSKDIQKKAVAAIKFIDKKIDDDVVQNVKEAAETEDEIETYKSAFEDIKDRSAEIGVTFDEFFQNFAPRKKAIIENALRDFSGLGTDPVQDYETAVDEAMARAYMKYDPKGGASLDTYASNAIENALNDVKAVYAKKNSDHLSLDKTNEQGEELHEAIPDENASAIKPEDSPEKVLAKWRAGLFPRDQRILSLKEEGLSPSEIGRKTGKTTEEIKARLNELETAAYDLFFSSKRVRHGGTYYNVPWKESMQKAVTDKSVREPVFVSETPEIFKRIGFTSLPMLMNVRHLRLNYYSKTDFEKIFGTMRQGEHTHNLRDKLKDLPAALEHPLAIVVNKTPNATPGSVVAITDMNVNGKKVVVPVLIESVKTINNNDIDSHLVLTVYDSKDWMEQFLTPAIKAEKNGVGIFYLDKQKANRYTAYSNKIGNIPTGFVHNIADAGINVKPQTETFQFKKFFKNSKVVDQNGKPLVVYHGSSADFNVFDHRFGYRNGAAEGRGFYFTSDKNKAEGYKTEKGKLFEVYLRLQKPLNPDELTITKAEAEKIIRAIDNDGTYVADYAEDDIGYPGKTWHNKAVKKAVNAIYDSSENNADIVAELYSVFGQGDALSKITEATGYDGFIKDDVYVVFNPTQIKSATDNIGTFDPENPDIRYSTKRLRHQIIPIVRDGQVRSEYRDLLLENKYTPTTLKELQDKALDWIVKRGGIVQAAEDILANKAPSEPAVAEIVRRFILNSDVFANDMTFEDRVKLNMLEMDARSRAGLTLRSMRLDALNLKDVAAVQALLNKLHKDMPPADVRKLREQIKDKIGIDIFSLPEDIVKDKSKLDAVLREHLTHKASFGEKIYEYWINSILSGPATHATNLLGNTANAVYELGIKRFTEALVNLAARRKDGATFGEFKQMTRAFNWGNAMKAFRQALDLETLDFSGKFLENRNIAIGGKTGRFVRYPVRFLKAADAFAKALIEPMETAAYAYRLGVQEGFSGTKLQEYIQDQLTNKNSKANAWGQQRAKELVFQEDLPEGVKKLILQRESKGAIGLALKLFLPFVATPYNITKQGIRKGPLGTLYLLGETGALLLGKREFDSEYIGRVAEQIIAWGAFMAVMSLGDDDEPWITGSSAPYGSAEYGFKGNKIPPFSIRIGGSWYSYQRIEPLATGLAVIADGIKHWKNIRNGKEGSAVMRDIMRGMKQVILEKSFIDSISEISKAFDDPESFARAVANPAKGLVPNMFTQIRNSFEENTMDNKSREKGLKWIQDQFVIMSNKAGVTTALPKVDYFGREVKKDDFGDSFFSPLGRLQPVRRINATENIDPAERLILNYNRKNPNDEYYPSLPRNSFSEDGEKYYFAGEAYHDFAVEVGKLAHRQINNAIKAGKLNVGNPSEKDIQLIKDVFSRARKESQKKLRSKAKKDR